MAWFPSVLDRRFRGSTMGIFLLLLLFVDCASAGSGSSIRLPMGNKRVKNGIIADLNWHWVDGFGHRPLRIELTVRKTNRDRTVTVHLFPNSWSTGHVPMRIECDIEIPEGQKSVSKTVYVPQEGYWNYLRADFFEGGKKLKDLSMDYGTNWNSNYYNGGEKPCLLIVDADAPRLSEPRAEVVKELRSEYRRTKTAQQKLPNLETIEFLSIGNNNRSEDDDDYDASLGYRDVDSLSILDSAVNMELIAPQDLPSVSLGLGSIDLLILSASEFQSLKTNMPERFAAIDAFTRNGGNLIVFGTSSVSQIVSAELQQKHQWQNSRPEAYIRSTSRIRYGGKSLTVAEYKDRLRKELAALPVFKTADHGLGRIVASEAEDPFLQKPIYWRFMKSELGPNRLSWIDRHGVSLDSENQDFWDFLIPGYGATPVISFLSVITVFVIVIGPINFFFLKRAKRFYLLPFTVVLAAIVTTAVMMLYAFLSDGVQKRVRLRSFTSLDRKMDDTLIASTHCRHAYLATVAPNKGLVFPEHTTAYPISPQQERNARRQQRVTRQKKREFHNGYIGSRSTSQFLTTDVQPTECQLSVQKNPDGTISGTNRMGTPIAHAWVTDSQGGIYYAQDIPDGGGMSFSAVATKVAAKTLNDILIEHRPEPPPGLDKAQTYGFGFSRYSLSSKPAYLEEALLNDGIVETVDELRQGAPNRTYAITFLAPPFVQQGLSATEEAGFHVVRGGWSDE